MAPADVAPVELEQVLVRAGPVPYHSPYTVVKVLGRYTFVLSDGQRWSAHTMKRWFHDLLLQMAGVDYEDLVQVPPVADEAQMEEHDTRHRQQEACTLQVST